jgi:hypothetical protein
MLVPAAGGSDRLLTALERHIERKTTAVVKFFAVLTRIFSIQGGIDASRHGRLTPLHRHCRRGEGKVTMCPPEYLGFAASTAVLASFCMSTMLSLRSFALLSNVLFIGYGILGHVYPVLVLHLLLLPVNLIELLRRRSLHQIKLRTTGRQHGSSVTEPGAEPSIYGQQILLLRRTLDDIMSDPEFPRNASISVIEIAQHIAAQAAAGERNVNCLKRSALDKVEQAARLAG